MVKTANLPTPAFFAPVFLPFVIFIIKEQFICEAICIDNGAFRVLTAKAMNAEQSKEKLDISVISQPPIYRISSGAV